MLHQRRGQATFHELPRLRSDEVADVLQVVEGGLVLAVGEHAVEEDGVEVGVEAHVGRCPLHDRDGAALAAGRGRAETAPVEAEHGVHEDARDRAQGLGVVGEKATQLKGERQDPLA
jgi:hypothetical protein